jgi:type VI secretion system protein ImpK
MSPVAQATPVAIPAAGERTRPAAPSAPPPAPPPAPPVGPAAPPPAARVKEQPAIASRAALEEQKRSLPDLCAGLFAYVLWLRALPEGQGPEVRAVYQRFDELLREIDNGGKRNGVAPESVRLVLFALAAFADEMILTSKLAFRSSWADQPLQLTYFNENAAGEEFFIRLESSRKLSDGSAADVLESFYLCLSLGFKGRFGGSPKLEKQRRSLMEKLAADIRALHGVAGGLSPHSGRPLLEARVARGFSPWLIPTILLLVVLVVLILLNTFLRIWAVDAAAAFS